MSDEKEASCRSCRIMRPRKRLFGTEGLIRRPSRIVNRSLLVLLAPLVLVTLTACGFYGVDGTRGSGNLLTETRELGSFTRIDIRGGANVELTVDPNLTQSVSVTYDDNVIGFIVTRVDAKTLIIDTAGSFSITGGPRRVVTVVTDDIEVIGSGVTESYRLQASDGSDVDLVDLQASSVEIDVSGGSDVSVFVSESITGQASGAADIEIFGSPANLDVRESGAADVSLRG